LIPSLKVLDEFDVISRLRACRAEFEAFNAVLDRHEQGLVRMYLDDINQG
jgi:hypothetical protein